jgi:nicotinamide-nucleotide amidase
MFPEDVTTAAARVLGLARLAGVTLTTVESASGGLVAAALAAVPGSSDVFTCGLVTFSNRSKVSMVGVSPTLIEVYGAVSDIVAVAMAEGGVRLAGGGVAVATTGIAGPGGATPDYPGNLAELRLPAKGRPVGLVHFAVAREGRPTLHREMQFGEIGRDAVRLESVRFALAMLTEALDAPLTQAS